MFHHYMTRYQDDSGDVWYESWLQIDLLGKCFCFSKRRYRAEERSPEGERQAWDLFHLLPAADVGGSLSPVPMVALWPPFTAPPRGPTSTYRPFGRLSVPGL